MSSPVLTPAELNYALAHKPGLRPPLGVTPNFVSPYSRGYLIVATTVITLTVTTLLVLIRTYTKRFINKTGLGWDDCELWWKSYSGNIPLTGALCIDLSILAWVGIVEV